ncbi:Mur ligase family protein [Arenimonas sp.]|jgi:UDP-N-acetylmuramyl tripeptide synthase|uniref:Mur ligase family protein n=1 Tax=Arenimonas sp. TaxID=1872635 RepID=UPI0037BE8C35
MAFTDSRRLTGPNVYFAVPGVVLEARATGIDEAQCNQWMQAVTGMAGLLCWPSPYFVSRCHAKGATLAFTAPMDQLFAATEVNEWAWSSVCGDAEMHAPGFPLIGDADAAARIFRKSAAAECEPALMRFSAAAQDAGWPVLLDDDSISIGFGAQTQLWPRAGFQTPEDVLADHTHRLPVAMVTGSNGKTTTVRLLAAMARACGLASGHNCTDGLFFNGELIEADDYAGPAGARATLRHPMVQAAILETARGGLLRRGLATDQADVALVTNVSEDHFGEYGVFTLDDLARVKLSVARGLKHGGVLVLNAADPMLVKHSADFQLPMAWFARDWQHPVLAEKRLAGVPVCGIEDARLLLAVDGVVQDFGDTRSMPLSFGGMAAYNLDNIAGAALAAVLLGFTPSAIANCLQAFGLRHLDNPGRLQSWQFGDVRVLMDYAHNPEGLRGFLDIAKALQGEGRMAVLLGQAGNRENDDIVKLAETVAQYAPEQVVLKEMVGYERGRAPGEVPALLQSALLQNGIAAGDVHVQLDEVQAVCDILLWARPGDVMALPVHGLAEREAVQGLLDAMQVAGWQAGRALPDWPSLHRSDASV